MSEKLHSAWGDGSAPKNLDLEALAQAHNQLVQQKKTDQIAEKVPSEDRRHEESNRPETIVWKAPEAPMARRMNKGDNPYFVKQAGI